MPRIRAANQRQPNKWTRTSLGSGIARILYYNNGCQQQAQAPSKYQRQWNWKRKRKPECPGRRTPGRRWEVAEQRARHGATRLEAAMGGTEVAEQGGPGERKACVDELREARTARAKCGLLNLCAYPPGPNPTPAPARPGRCPVVPVAGNCGADGARWCGMPRPTAPGPTNGGPGQIPGPARRYGRRRSRIACQTPLPAYIYGDDLPDCRMMSGLTNRPDGQSGR